MRKCQAGHSHPGGTGEKEDTTHLHSSFYGFKTNKKPTTKPPFFSSLQHIKANELGIKGSATLGRASLSSVLFRTVSSSVPCRAL